MSNKLKAVSFNEHDDEHMIAYDKANKLSNFSQFVRDCLHGLVEADSSNFRSTNLIEMKIANLKLKLGDDSLDRTTHWRIQKKIDSLERLKNISKTDFEVNQNPEDDAKFKAMKKEGDRYTYLKKPNEKIKQQIYWYKLQLEKMENGAIKKTKAKVIEYNSAISVLNWVLPESERVFSIGNMEQGNEDN